MKNAEKGYILRVPYPHPTRPEKPVGQNVRNELHAAAGGQRGALTAFCRCLQRAAVCRAQGEDELAALFEAGAQTAYRRLCLLTEMTVCCGGDPAFFVPKGGHKIWWSASWVPNARNVDVLLRNGLQDALADCTACRALLPVLPACLQPCGERLLADAEHHADCFRAAWLERSVN